MPPELLADRDHRTPRGPPRSALRTAERWQEHVCSAISSCGIECNRVQVLGIDARVRDWDLETDLPEVGSREEGLPGLEDG
jgi:hypothetical protein